MTIATPRPPAATAGVPPGRHCRASWGAFRKVRGTAKIGVLCSQKGPSGGYSLARQPKDITLLEVVEAVDGQLRGDAGTVGREGAALDKRLQVGCDEVLALVRERLAKVTLAELAKGK